MEISQEDFKTILLDFSKLNRDVHSMSYDRNLRKYQLRDKNFEVLKAFFGSVGVCFDCSEKKDNFRSAAELYFSRVKANPFDENEINSSINQLQSLLSELENTIIYNRFLGVLSEYAIKE